MIQLWKWGPSPRMPKQVIVMTGCASGIGRHLATVLVAQGHNVVATDINEAALTALAREQKWATDQVLVRQLDVREQREWECLLDEAIQRWGRLDLLLNVAGYLQAGYVHDIAPEEIERHLDVNTKGVIYGTRAAAIRMVAQGHGHIINMASLAGIAPVPGLALYSASKFAVRGFSLAVAQELRPYGVYVTAICPDAVQTPMLDRQRPYPEAAVSFSGDRPLTVEEVERAILEQAIPHKPLEVLLPRSRAWAAKLSSFLPRLIFLLGPWARKRGLARQRHFMDDGEG